jgi:hypothetical protein
VQWSHDLKYIPVVAGGVADNLKVLMFEAATLKGAAFARSTVQTYKSQTNSYLRFCVNYGLQPVPATQQTLCSYMAFLSRSLTPSSVKGYMNAVRLLHIESGFVNPLIDNWEISMIQRGMSRLIGSWEEQTLHALRYPGVASCAVPFSDAYRCSTPGVHSDP